jgi:hypothetical protein
VAQQKQGLHAQPRQELSNYDYDQQAILNSPLVASYMDHFGLAAETSRRTGA